MQVEVANKRAPLEQRKRKRAPDGEGEGAEAAEAAVTKSEEAPKPSKPAAAVAKSGKPIPGLAAAVMTPEQRGRQLAAPAKPAPKAAHAPLKDAAAMSAKHKLMRTVALGNLTSEIMTQALNLAKKAGTVEEVVNPAPESVVGKAKLHADGCSGNIVLVVYDTVRCWWRTHSRVLTAVISVTS